MRSVPTEVVIIVTAVLSAVLASWALSAFDTPAWVGATGMLLVTRLALR